MPVEMRAGKDGRVVAYVRYKDKRINGGRTVRFSTKQSDRAHAETEEILDRARRLEGRLGIVDQDKANAAIPTLAEFIDNKYTAYARDVKYGKDSSSFIDWIQPGLQAIKAYPKLADTKITEIDQELLLAFARFRHDECGLTVNTVNGSLRAVSAVLTYAVEKKVMKGRPRLKYLKGEEGRDYVLAVEDEVPFLEAAEMIDEKQRTQPWGGAACLWQFCCLLLDTGLRPEEAERLRWENVYWDTNAFLTKFGKTKQAHRQLAMTPRVREILEKRFVEANKPRSGFVFAADNETGHISPSTLQKPWNRIFEILAAQMERPLEHFVSYSLRHTYLTRLATTKDEKGGQIDLHTFMKISGHKSVQMGMKYVHPGTDQALKVQEEIAKQRAKMEKKGPVLLKKKGAA